MTCYTLIPPCRQNSSTLISRKPKQGPEILAGFIWNLSQGTEALRSHPRDREAQWEAEKQRLHAKIGELALEVDVLKKVHRILGKDLPDGIS